MWLHLRSYGHTVAASHLLERRAWQVEPGGQARCSLLLKLHPGQVVSGAGAAHRDRGNGPHEGIAGEWGGGEG